MFERQIILITGAFQTQKVKMSAVKTAHSFNEFILPLCSTAGLSY